MTSCLNKEYYDDDDKIMMMSDHSGWGGEYFLTGLEKILNSSLPFGQVALKFCLA